MLKSLLRWFRGAGKEAASAVVADTSQQKFAFPGQSLFLGKRTVVLDVETTGLDPFRGQHRIISVAGLEFIDGMSTNSAVYLLFNPERPSDRVAREIHGFESFVLAHQDKFEVWAADLRDWIGDAEVVAHNAAFDVDFLNEEFRRASVRPIQDERVSCTVEMFRNYFTARGQESPSARLDNVTAFFGLAPERGIQHSAIVDAVLCASAYFTLKTGSVRRLALEEKELKPKNFKVPPIPQKRNAREVTREMVVETMARYKTKSATAKALGISVSTVSSRLGGSE